MAGSGVSSRLTLRQRADKCHREALAVDYCKTNTTRAAAAACKGNTGMAYGRCMDAQMKYQARIKCKTYLDACAVTASKASCAATSFPCNQEAAIKSWIAGIDPAIALKKAADAKKKAAAAKKAAADKEAAALRAADEAEFAAQEAMNAEYDAQAELQASQSPDYVPGKGTRGPLGVPLWGWVAGGAAVALFLYKR